jgi:hypothetical protein
MSRVKNYELFEFQVRIEMCAAKRSSLDNFVLFGSVPCVRHSTQATLVLRAFGT